MFDDFFTKSWPASSLHTPMSVYLVSTELGPFIRSIINDLPHDIHHCRPTYLRCKLLHQALEGTGPAISFIVILLLYIVLSTDSQGVLEQTRQDEEKRPKKDEEQATTNKGTIRYTQKNTHTEQ